MKALDAEFLQEYREIDILETLLNQSMSKLGEDDVLLANLHCIQGKQRMFRDSSISNYLVQISKKELFIKSSLLYFICISFACNIVALHQFIKFQCFN